METLFGWGSKHFGCCAGNPTLPDTLPRRLTAVLEGWNPVSDYSSVECRGSVGATWWLIQRAPGTPISGMELPGPAKPGSRQEMLGMMDAGGVLC